MASLVVGSTLASAVAFADPPAQAQNGQGGHSGRHHRHGGDEDEAMLGFALNHINLNGVQRSQLEQVKAGLRPSGEAVKNARRDLMTSLAPEVSANNVDGATLQPKIDALAAAVAARRAAEDTATDRLHAILDTAQRAELASGLEARMSAREQARAQHEAERAQNPQPQRTPGAGIARALSLTPAQAQQVASILQQERASATRPDFAAMHAQRVAMLEGFKGASFSASSFDTSNAAGHAKAGAERFVDTAGRITQILTAEQRATAAQKLATGRGRMVI